MGDMIPQLSSLSILSTGKGPALFGLKKKYLVVFQNRESK